MVAAKPCQILENYAEYVVFIHFLKDFLPAGTVPYRPGVPVVIDMDIRLEAVALGIFL